MTDKLGDNFLIRFKIFLLILSNRNSADNLYIRFILTLHALKQEIMRRSYSRIAGTDQNVLPISLQDTDKSGYSWLKTCFTGSTFFGLFIFLFIVNQAVGQKIGDFSSKGAFDPLANQVRTQSQFNGYTSYWHNDFKEWIRYGNLFKMSIPNVGKSIAQSKIDIAEDMHLPGLSVQEGFISGLLSSNYKILDTPSIKELEEAISSGNTLVFTDPGSETGIKLMAGFKPDSLLKIQLRSYQLGAANLQAVDAFVLENGERRLFVVSSTDPASRKRLGELIQNTKKVVAGYDLHKGWFGAETLLKSVTCVQGHPLEVIGKGMNEGNSWFIFSGYMDFWMKDELAGWMNKTNLPVVADVGFSPIFGCKNYKGIQVQDMITKQSWIDFAHSKEGFVFRPVDDLASDPFHYDGYIATEGNKKQIDNENVPFVSATGSMEGDLIPSMVLFIKKGEKITRDLIWEAIMDRREVAVLNQGKMMGPALYRNTLQMLLLDRFYLEEYFGDRIDLQADVEDYALNFTISNTYPYAVSGAINLNLPPEVKAVDAIPSALTLPANTSKTIQIRLQPLASGMNGTNPVVAGFTWSGKKKATMAILDLPPVISVHQLLYGHAPSVKYPVSIHNFSSTTPFPVQVQVFAREKPDKALFTANQTNTAPFGKFQNMIFDLKLGAGDYIVKVSTLGITTTSQLGVGRMAGVARAYPVDLNSDGVNEFRLENDSVQVTLLSTGARVIEYIVKSRKDNLLFKLWPEKSVDDRRPFRERGYYPYGGFEDFLGQGSMETHKIYDANLVQDHGDFVQVKMVADYYGNTIEKIFTLYGNSPLLEIRFALTFKNPEANVLGPQPILELGANHGTEDVFTIPSVDGLEQFRMKPERYYGHLFTLKEGWNAGYDEKEDITFVGAYPVAQPLFLHMWMNHPSNGDAHYYYSEFQPWVPITRKSTMYFSYYMWGAAGQWENGVKELRKRNLITTR
jgi:hypothetical protein